MIEVGINFSATLSCPVNSLPAGVSVSYEAMGAASSWSHVGRGGPRPTAAAPGRRARNRTLSAAVLPAPAAPQLSTRPRPQSPSAPPLVQSPALRPRASGQLAERAPCCPRGFLQAPRAPPALPPSPAPSSASHCHPALPISEN